MVFLLERLAIPAGQGPAFDLETAVAAQIQRIVGARVLETRGGEISLLECGLPNVVELAYNSKLELQRYAARLKRLIMHYEPRLLDADITLEDTSDRAAPYRLVVSGRLAPHGEARTFVFELPQH
jgi:predicted component of type VI protein secretion system